jgi:hypothetical protein
VRGCDVQLFACWVAIAGVVLHNSRAGTQGNPPGDGRTNATAPPYQDKNSISFMIKKLTYHCCSVIHPETKGGGELRKLQIFI